MLHCHFLSLQVGQLVVKQGLLHVRNRGLDLLALQTKEDGLFNVFDHYRLIGHRLLLFGGFYDIATRTCLSETCLEFVVGGIDYPFILVGF